MAIPSNPSDLAGFRIPAPYKAIEPGRWDIDAIGSVALSTREITEYRGLSVCTFNASGLCVKATDSFTVGTGSFQWEVQCDADSSSPAVHVIGLIDSGFTAGTMNGFPGNDAHGVGYYANDGHKFVMGGGSSVYGSQYNVIPANRDILTFVVDGAGDVRVAVGGTIQNVLVTLTAGTVWYPATGSGSASGIRRTIYNSGAVHPLVYPQIGYTPLGLAQS